MKISSRLFEAFLKCPTKCWLRATGESFGGNAYAEWVKTQNESCASDIRLLGVAQSCRFQEKSFLGFLRSGLSDVDAYTEARRRKRRLGSDRPTVKSTAASVSGAAPAGS